MRMRYRSMTYRYVEGSPKPLEQHYRQMLNDALLQNQQSILHRSITWRPLADILESPDMIQVKIELAGMKEEDIEVTLYEDALVISGERRNNQERLAGLNYHEAQIRYGPFRIEVLISTPIKRDAIVAHYEYGMLSVDLPKLSATKTEQVRIQRTPTKE